MGQTLRRATGKIKSSSSMTPPRSYPKNVENTESFKRRTLESIEPIIPDKKNWDIHSNDVPGSSTLEEKDPKYEAMLNELTGRVRVTSVPTTEVKEGMPMTTTRPLPKKRTPEAGGEKSAVLPPGTIDVPRLRQILLLHEGKAENQKLPLDADSIAEKYQLDVLVVQKLLNYVSLAVPVEPEEKKEEKKN
eukprot:TRINITY_DN6067_c1_g1_i1.p1 TRINITY_DN6067_c1_g1~~TRINITY_DN6067_c1_g1_i1.p1  ORF type:complete len:190 (+),score=55.36 TRINITY_DN6067_c1_g1_i1:255-824(+)